MNCTTLESGTKIWKNDKGQIHRDDGPAITWTNGNWEWWFEDKCHRIEGPSDWLNGEHRWFVHDKNITKLVRECLEKVPEFNESIHLGILADKMAEMGDFRLQEHIEQGI